MKTSFPCFLAQIRAQDKKIYSCYDFDVIVVSQDELTVKGRFENGETVLLAKYKSEEELRDVWDDFVFVSGSGAGIFTFRESDWHGKENY